MISDHNYFEMFDFAPAYSIDLDLLSEHYRQLQKIYHPDKYAGKPSRDIRLAVQRASLVNQAYDTLKSPVLRAQYLLEIKGVDANLDRQVTTDSAFLMQQMEMREGLQSIPDEQDPFSFLEQISNQAHQTFLSLQVDFERNLNTENLSEAVDALAKMQFFSKFFREIEDMEERLDDES